MYSTVPYSFSIMILEATILPSIVQHVNICIYGLFVLFGQLVCMFLLVFWIRVPLFLKALEGKSAYASVCL